MSSPIRARSEASPRAASVTWTWSFPGAPISVNLPLGLITRLRVAIADQGSSRTEIGGLLLGSPGRAPDTIDILDYVLIPSTTQSEEEYSLRISELERLRRQNTGYGFDKNGARQFPVIGYFRTQLAGALELRGPEVDLIKEYFPEPSNVVLLIQTHQNLAGFFCWYGDIFTPFSFKDFPFDVASLRPDMAGPTALPPILEPAEVAKTVTNWAEQHSRSPWAFVTVAAVVLALAGLSGLLLRERRPNAPPPRPPIHFTSAPANSLPVKLEVEAQGNGLNIRWNPRSTPVEHAAEARLVILKQNQDPETVLLDSEQLGSGHVYYQSAEKQLGFRLELVGDAGKVVATESVLALSSAKPDIAPAEKQPKARASETKAEPPQTQIATERASNRSRRSPTRTASSERVVAVPIRSPQRPVPTIKVSPILETWLAELIPADRRSQVIVTIYVDETGRVIRAEPLRYEAGVNRRLEEAAVRAAMQWQFEPARLDDRPVPGEYTVKFDFRN